MPASRQATKADVAAVRERGRRVRASVRDVAAELSRLYGMRPRVAFRRAHGWTLREAASRFNASLRQDPGGDGGPVRLTASRLCDFEAWPQGGRKPPPYVLAGLAAIYGTTVETLLDYDDHTKLTVSERLALRQDAADPRAGCGHSTGQGGTSPTAPVPDSAVSGGDGEGQLLVAIPDGANVTLTMRWLPGGLAIGVTTSGP